GNGTVIATTIYTDWAYGHYQATSDAKHLIRDMVVCAKNPKELPDSGSGDTVNIPINATSYIDLASDKVKFMLIDPDKNAVDTINVTTSISPYETKTVNFTDTAPSKLGIWHLDYSLMNDSAGEVQRVHDVQRFAVSKYAENPDGWVYKGKRISYGVNSESEDYAYGSNGTFTIQIWNHGDVDKNVTCWWSFPHNYGAKHDPIYGSPGTTRPGHRSNLYRTLTVPAHGEASFVYSIPVYSYDRLWADFYEGDETSHTRLGGASRAFYSFRPSVGIDVKTNKDEYEIDENVLIPSNLKNKQSVDHNVTVIVKSLDPDNKKIYDETFNANLSAYASENKTLNFTLPSDAGHGVYVVTAEAYEDGNKIGSDSTYFGVRKAYSAELSFDKPDKVYKVRQNMIVYLNITNVGAVLWNSTVNTSIPDLAFEDSKFVVLNPNETEEIRYDLNIGNLTAGKHDVIVTVSRDDSTIKDCFFIPCSDLRIEFDKKGVGAGENLSFNISNVGGVDTDFNCSFKLVDWKGTVMHKGAVEDAVLSQGSRTISFKIPNQSVNGLYYLIVSCKDIKTGKETESAAKCEASGLKAALISNTERRVYFKNENVSILTDITNLNGEIVNGTLNLKIARVSMPNSTERALARATAELSAIHSSSKNSSSYNTLTPQPYLSLLATNSSHSPNLHNLIATARAVSSPANVTPTPEPSPEDEFNESNDKVDTTVLRAPGLTCTCGDICVNETGWWRDGGAFNASGTPIQAAINNATAGDTICVKDGTYNENVDVNVNNLIIKSENGSANCIVNASNPADHVFEVTGNYVNISGFTIGGATGEYFGYYAGIYLDDYTHNCMISNNTIVNNTYGIRLHKSNHNMLINTTASSNTYGIYLSSSSTNNRLTNNIASGNRDGIGLYSSSNYNTLTNNTANSNDRGIVLYDSHNNTLTNNTANSNPRYNGIILTNSNDNVLAWNTCLDNTHGIRLMKSNRNRLEQNNCSSNYHGFELQSSRYNTIRNNIANENSEHGMYIYRTWAVDPRSAVNTFINNNVSNNTKDGIKLANQALYNNLTDNNVSMNKNDGISLGGSCNHNNLAGNTVNGNSRYGIWMTSSQYNNLTRNIVNANTGRGIYMRGSSNNNMLYNNYFNNTNNAYDEGHNIWNITKTLGTNIIGGPWLGGNYWSNYAGEDSDGDGLGDTFLPYNCSGRIMEGGDYLPLVMPLPPKEVLWEENITINLAEGETKNIISEVPASVFKDVTGKQKLSTTFYSKTTQIINISDPFFYVTPKNTSLILETDKRVYKPNETVLIYGEVKNHASIAMDYNLSIKKDSVEIFNDSFTLATDETRYYTTNTRADASFTLEGTVDGVVVLDSLSVDSPEINASIIAPGVVEIKDFDVGVLIENIGDLSADLNVNLDGKRWNITVPEGESQLLETTMNTSWNMTITVIISGDVTETIQKEIICGERVGINITPEPTYLEGEAEIPFTINNTGVRDSEFNATFSISSPDNQTITKHFFVPRGENITDSVSFNLTKGAHLLRYTSPFETVNRTINVLSPPEFVVTSIHPAERNFTIGENVTLVFTVKNVGGSEGEATLKLAMIDFEDTNRTWIIAGAEENISFYFSIPDDLEEKSYKGIYVLDGTRSEFSFFVQGANISVDASLDKSMYAEGDTAVLTLELTNECALDLDVYSRVKFNEYDSVQNFTLAGSGTETLVFYLPANFSGDNKVLYTVYMDSGRALYINSIYIYEELPDAPLRLFTDKDVYNMGEEVTIHIVDVTGIDMLNLTAPNFSYNDTISGPTTLEFTLPELRSGTYYIEYSFGNFSSTHPFDVRGYSARILEASLDKEEYISGNEMKLEMNIEANRDVSGLLKTWIYDPEENLIDEFEMNKILIAGENKIEVCRTLSTDKSGIHAIVYGFSAELSSDSSTTLVSGAEYFDAESVGLCGDVAPYPDCNGIVDMGDVILLLNNVSYPEDPRYALCNDWAGDCRCTGVRDMGDVILLLNNVSYPEDPRYVLECC
ncbi:hypothetical protein C4E22_05040, partial [ANME-1 cluster archaeon AG-394-G06]|nr:hypothetical protein [ANME-1 cluster archaeon AG-394-G06]